jgi:hypothetical protein
MTTLTITHNEILKDKTHGQLQLDADGDATQIATELSSLWQSFSQGYETSGVRGLIRDKCIEKGINPERVLGN